MTPADGGLSGAARAVLLYQAALTGLAAAAFMYLGGLWPAIAALYGGLVAMVLSWMLKRRVTRVADDSAGVSAGKSMLLLYLGVVQRFLLVLALFALALGVLKLDPLASIAGFGLGQLGYVISRVSHKG